MMITSLQNLKIKDVVRLRRRRGREQCDLILIEGEREVARVQAQGLSLYQVFFCPELASKSGCALAETLRNTGAEFLECSRPVFEKLSLREGPDGLLALVRPPEWDLTSLPLRANPLILVVEGVEKPGNLGALIRSADAVNADAVLVCDPVTDLYNPNVVRASTGTLFSRPVVPVSSARAISWLREKGIQIAAAVPEEGVEYFRADLSGPLALVLGAEHEGLSVAWREAADLTLKIPMCGQADSLNVAAAGVLLLFDSLRQRS
jgi:TrmH family RNA methyltransferase